MQILVGARRYAGELFNLPGLLRNLSRYRELILTMTLRDFTARYRGSFGGLFWSLVQPLIMMVIYTIVFSLFLKVRFSTDANPVTFSVYLLCGLLPWVAFSEGLSASTTVIQNNINLVKRVVFPLEILPINLCLVAAVQQAVGFVLLVPLAWWVIGQLHWTVLLAVPILGLQLMFAIGMNWILASLTVYLPDLRQIISPVLIAWMFLTPVFYPEDVVPPQALVVFRANPMARIIKLYREAFLSGQLPCLDSLVVTVILCLLVFLLGYFWFMHTKKGFADVL